MNASNEEHRKYLGDIVDVKGAHRFDVDVLERYLSYAVVGFAGPVSVRQFESGQSNLTYLLTTPSRSYVLRRKPPGVLLKSAHAVDREFRVPLTICHLERRLGDGVSDGLADDPELSVLQGRRPFEQRQRPNEGAVDLMAGNREVVYRPLRLGLPFGGQRHPHLVGRHHDGHRGNGH